MPGENGLWRHDRRKLREQLTSEQNTLGCQAAPLIIAETQALPTKLLFQQTILFPEVVDDA
jgi:hypothetical protein